MLAYAPKPHARKFSPTSFALAVALPGTALAALMLAAPEIITIAKDPPIFVKNYQDPPPPPPTPDKADTPDTPVASSDVTTLDPIVPVPMPQDIFTPYDKIDAVDIGLIVPEVPEASGGGSAPITEIVREDARLLTPADRQRPPYPERRRRMGDEAVLKLTLTIGADGRVTAVDPVGEMPADFLRSAERHIKRVWRYAPATEDGRNIQSVKTITLRFTLVDA